MTHARLIRAAFAALAGAFVLAGCNTTQTTLDPTPDGKNLVATPAKPPADAAVSFEKDPHEGIPTVQAIAKGRYYASRQDPFRLLPQEVKFDREQKAERILAEGGSWSNMYEPTVDAEQVPKQLQPRPLWRISGIVVSENGIVALLDLGDHAMVIRPGMKIDGSPFMVASIDAGGAVLRRLDGQEPNLVPIELSGPLVNNGSGIGVGNGGAAGSGAGGAPAGGGGPGQAGAAEN